MRLLVIGHNLQVGGAEKGTLCLLQYLVSRGAEVDLCLLAGGPLEREIPKGLRSAYIGQRGHARTVSWAYAAAGRSDIVFAAIEGSPVYLAAVLGRLHRRPSMAWIHLEWSKLSALVGSPARPWHKPCSALFYPMVDKTVCITEGVERDLHALYPRMASRTVVLPNPFPIQEIISQGHQTVAGLDAGGPYIAAVGRLIAWKGFDLLLIAFREVLDRLPEMRLLIVGDGPERERLRVLAQDLKLGGRVIFTGESHQVAALMRGAELTVVASRREPFGRVVVESLAVGTPVVAFDSPGPAQILGSDLPELLVPPGDTQALAERIVRLLTEDARERLAARLPGVANRFDIARIGPLFEQHFHQLLERKINARKIRAGKISARKIGARAN
jgi:glycosyltransferase involved in cell wall biosynthesis